MAHFAKINANNIVEQTIVVANNCCAGGDFPVSEIAGQAYIAGLGLTGTWKQTSYNGNFRQKYAEPGDAYDPVLDIFVPPEQPISNES